MKKFILWCLLIIWLNFSAIFAQNIYPDAALIEVNSQIYEWEATNMTISMIKNWNQMTSYVGWISMDIYEEETWRKLTSNEYTLPNQWRYSFSTADQWSKTFQRGLEIKKEWKYYIEVLDLVNDLTLWKASIKVVSKNSQKDIQEIFVLNPTEWSTITNESISIIWMSPDLPNSNVNIYIDDNLVETTSKVSTDYEGQINYTLSNISKWHHTLKLEIIDIWLQKVWESKVINFDYIPTTNELFKSISLNPSDNFLVWDSIDVTIYTDEIAESVKLRTTDRDEEMITTRKSNWEFFQKLFLSSVWTIDFSVDISSYNNSSNQTYESIKTIEVKDIPNITNIVTVPYPSTQTVEVDWDVENWPVQSYIIQYGTEESELKYEKFVENETHTEFTSVPYDTTFYFQITPYWDNWERHWSASRTVQFIITKPVGTCWNWILEEWENCQNCPEDAGQCPITCWNWIIDDWENCDNCPWDIWLSQCIVQKPTCTVQAINTKTQKIWDNYFLIRDKVDNVSKYIVYSSTSPNISSRVKVYETSDTSYEYPFDKNSETDQFMYFWIDWICDWWEEIQLESATKVQVWPTENFFLLICMTLLIYFWIKIFRITEE